MAGADLIHSGEKFEDSSQELWRCYSDDTLRSIIRRMFQLGGPATSIHSDGENFEALGAALFYLCGRIVDRRNR